MSSATTAQLLGADALVGVRIQPLLTMNRIIICMHGGIICYGTVRALSHPLYRRSDCGHAPHANEQVGMARVYVW